MKIDEFLDRTVALATDADRSDLVDRLNYSRRRWQDPAIRVLVVGEFKQGKSALVNALVNASVCAVDVSAATTIPTVVKYGNQPSARIVLADPSHTESELSGALTDGPTISRPIDVAELAHYTSESGNRDNEHRLLYAEAALPHDLLHGGLEIVDTPGVGSLNSGYAGATASALPAADALLFVSDASSEYTAAELAFLKTALRSCPNAACIVSKIDAYADWERIAQINRDHLSRAGMDFPVIPVSSRLRQLAIQHDDQELHAESGFAELVRHLRQDVVDHAHMLAARNVANDVLAVTDNLRSAWEPELAALKDPARLPEVLLVLEQAKADAQALRERSATWQTTLSDGMGDLISDLDHDVRERLRVVQRDAEAAIDADDPGKIWDDFNPWFDERVNAALAESFLWADESARWLADEVAGLFSASATDALPGQKVSDTTGLMERVPEMSELDLLTVSPFQKVMIGMRGSYGGVLMFGLLTGLMGMALINPISIGAGVLLGSRAYLEDREQRLARRRAEAKTLVRRRLDDIQFQVLKVMKDRLRHVQRNLRDHYTTVAKQVQRSMSEAITAAKLGAQQSAEERQQTVTEVERRIHVARSLGNGARKLLGLETA